MSFARPVCLALSGVDFWCSARVVVCPRWLGSVLCGCASPWRWRLAGRGVVPRPGFIACRGRSGLKMSSFSLALLALPSLLSLELAWAFAWPRFFLVVAFR